MISAVQRGRRSGASATDAACTNFLGVAGAYNELRGTDPRLNVIDISTQRLQDAKHIVVDAPADAVVVVDVSGASYAMNAGGT
ncbi:collagen-binding domain-containing protein [Streptomyces sp. NPDC005480]|uniref:collagen-binding domain-containing protein n=1 Tax=Streptomyces sp. NPDC005480 TaxID=3154880 RepID=UPI0033AAF86F